MKANTRKTTKATILTPVLILAGLLAGSATAQVNYTLFGNTALVGPSPNASGDIVIASTYNGFPVTRIGSQAFINCTNLTSVTIPNSITNIGGNAFRACTSLTNIAVAIDNPSYTSPDGVLYNKAQTTLIQFPGGRGGGYAISNGVTFIGPSAFYRCTGLANVTIPNTVVAILLDAFSGCTGLTGATIPDSVTTIQAAAFYRCTGLTNVTIPNSVTNIQSLAFTLCSSLTNITVAAANPAYSSPEGVLFDKAQTALIQFPGGRGGAYAIPNGVTNIRSSAFYACPNLTSVTIPNTVLSIGLDAFYACYSLTNATIGSSVISIGSQAFAGCTNLTSVTIPNSVTTIHFSAFRGCTSVTNLILGSSVSTIGDSAFSFCRSLGSVTIPNSVTNIEAGAFLGCTSLTNITVGAGNPVYRSMDGVLFNKAQTLLIQFPAGRDGPYIIPNGVTFVGDLAFYYCGKLTSVSIPNSVTTIGSTFYYCSRLTNYSVNAASSVFSSLDGALFNKAQTVLIQFPEGRSGSYVIPNSVIAIGSTAFYLCASLTNVTVPDSVTDIGFSAFYYCSNLTDLTFLGNAPILNGTVFYGVPGSATVYYYYGTSGWGTTFGGLPAIMLGAPAPQVGTASAGMKPGGFGFTITGVVNQTIVVEASTDLLHWQPIWTNTLSEVSPGFVDSQWQNYPHRFYRLKSN